MMCELAKISNNALLAFADFVFDFDSVADICQHIKTSATLSVTRTSPSKIFVGYNVNDNVADVFFILSATFVANNVL